jgi:hypothetical protein
MKFFSCFAKAPKPQKQKQESPNPKQKDETKIAPQQKDVANVTPQQKDEANVTPQQSTTPPTESRIIPKEKLPKTDEEWKKVLTKEQYHILREKGTERPGTGEYNKFFEDGKLDHLHPVFV